MTKSTPAFPAELIPFLSEEQAARVAFGEGLPEQEMDALADARRAAEARPAATVTPLPAARGGLLSIRPGQTEWDQEQIAALMAHCGLGSDVPQGDAFAFLHLCQRSGLDPWAREIYLIGRRETVGGQQRMRYQAQTGIDGYRHIAERTGEYLGKEGPWWCGPDGQWTDVWLAPEPPAAARVTILRAGRAPTTATAVYREFVPLRKVYEGYGDARRPKRNPDGSPAEEPQGLWGKMPAHMLAKCAEALAIRQAFPRQAAGIYVEEEMHQADARDADEAEDRARAERAAQRRELVAGFGPGDPAGLAQVAPGEVVEGEVEPERHDRDALLAELEEQARALGTTVPGMTRRWVLAQKRNLEDASDAELAEIVASRRDQVARTAEADRSVAAGDPEDDPMPGFGPEEPGPRAQEPPSAPQDATQEPEPGGEAPETPGQRRERAEAAQERAMARARSERRRRPADGQGTLA